MSKIVQYMRGKSSRKLQGEFQELRNGNGNNTCGQKDILLLSLDK
ncbi:MAG: hypothetical protein IJT08_00465 [Alphaproteobacteria bacterium]|nr:hypothetical protein [Alphaproteobacteria bacterium]